MDLEGQVRMLLDYIGVPFDESCLEFYKNNNPVSTLSKLQVRRKISTENIKKWELFSKYLTPLTHDFSEQNIFNSLE